MPKIKFLREEREIEVKEGENLRQAALRAGIQLYPGIHKYLNCHGLAQCGECRVHIKKGMENTSKPGLLEWARSRFSFFRIGHEDEVRLACQTKVLGDIEVYTQPEFNWFGQGKT
jgi:2Fe-2S ferredoxin